MKKTLLTLFSAFCVLPMLAQQISADDAMRTAQQFLGSGTRADAPVELAYTSTVNGKNHFYVFNAAQDGGFVIVGADRAANEILGYSFSGRFDYDNIPENFKWWLGQYDLQIEEGIREGISSRNAKTRAENVNGDYLIKTQWGQDAPYNKFIPKFDDKDCPTGCIATAMAQIMKYHGYPTNGTGTKEYTVYSKIIDGYIHMTTNSSALEDPNYIYTYSADFNVDYDWVNMKNDYLNQDSYSETQADAVARLMYHAGVSVEMLYTNNSSSAYAGDVPNALINYFGYDKSMRFVNHGNYTNEKWESLIQNEIAANRPVMYGGQGSNYSGHEFICDGYNGDKYHINWGWTGYCDGWFDISGSNALNNNVNQYNLNQDMIIGIKPDEGGNYAYSYCWVDAGGQKHELEKNVILEGENINIYGGFLNTSSNTFNGWIGAKFTNEKGEVTYSAFEGRLQAPANTYFWSTEPGYFSVSTENLNAGVYQFSLAIQEYGTDYWIDFTLPIDESWPTLYIATEMEHTFSGTLSSDGFGTIILPFATTEIPTGFNVYNCEQMQENYLVLSESSEIKPFTPYIIKGTGSGSYTFTGPLVPGTTYTSGLLKGIMSSDYILQAYDYVLQEKNGKAGFYKVGSNTGSAATPYRCVLNLPSSVSYSSIGIGEPGSTAIVSVEEETEGISGIYSIDGTRQTSLKKGINIVRNADGSTTKVIVK